MSASPPLDLNHLRQWIGRSEQADDDITRRLVTSLVATTGGDSTNDMEGVAPLAVHWCLAPPMVAMSMLGLDGHPARGGFLPPVPLPRRMWAGGRLEILDRLRIGDAVSRNSFIRDVTAKQGRTGTLCFVTVEHEISTVRGLAMRERQDIVYREADTAQPATSGAPVGSVSGPPFVNGQWHRTVLADPILLFRYSALTFNGHRIHYDHPYAVDIEHYPGLVVHGPLQATLLLNFATELRGSPPSSFTFRGLSPLIAGEFLLHAEEDGGQLKLWTARESGPVAMAAEAVWE